MSTVRFTEEMLGHITFGETDFARGAQPTREGSAGFKFHLTIEVADIDAFAKDPLRPARAAGWIHCDALGGQLPVIEGWFNLFVDQDEPGVKHMLYRLWFYDGVGHPLTMTGHKLVANDAGFDLWKDTTTLFTIASNFMDPHAYLIGGGIVGPNAGDLIAEVALAIEMGADAADVGLTIHPHPTLSETVAMAAEAFDGTLTDLYLPRKPARRGAPAD